MFSAGNFQYIFGVFVTPLFAYFGWSRASIAWAVSIRNIATSAITPVAGPLSDRFGAKRFIIAGVATISLSYLLATRISSLWQLYVSLGILTGVGIGLMVVPGIAIVSRWFGGKSALAYGVVFAGFGLAQVILPSVATWTILHYGWAVCFTGLAILAAVGGPVCWYFIKIPPPKAPQAGLGRVEVSPSEGEGWTVRAALHSWTLWSLALIYVVIAICYQIITIHIVAAAIDSRIPALSAAIILTVAGITNTAGRLIVSGIANKVGARRMLIGALAAQAVLMFFLMGAKTLPAYCVVVGLYGLFYGGMPPLVSAITGDYFGMKYFGSIFSIVNLFYNVGSTIGPLTAGYIFDATGRYSLAFLSAGIAMTLAFALSLTVRRPNALPHAG
jgi:MFS family permease